MGILVDAIAIKNSLIEHLLKIYFSMITTKIFQNVQSPGIVIANCTEPYLLSDPSVGRFWITPRMPPSHLIDQ